MAEIKQTEEIVETTEVNETNQGAVEAAVKEVSLFTKIGAKLDRGLTTAKVSVKKHGKKVAKGVGVAAGAVGALVVTGIALDVANNVKQLEAGTADEGYTDDGAPFEAENVEVLDVAATEAA